MGGRSRRGRSAQGGGGGGSATTARWAEPVQQQPWKAPYRGQPRWVAPRGRVTHALIRARLGMGEEPAVCVKRCPPLGGEAFKKPRTRHPCATRTPTARSSLGVAGGVAGGHVLTPPELDPAGDQNPARRLVDQDFVSHAPGPLCQQGSPRGRLPARTHAEARVQQQCATAPPGWLLPSSCRICPEAEPRLVEMRPPPVHSLRHRVGHRRFGAAPHGPIPIIVWREGATRRTWFNPATTARPCDARPKRRSD